MKERWRVFCAIELPQSVRSLVVDYIAKLRTASPQSRASWARPEALHITLKFFGEVEVTRVQAMETAAKNAAAQTERFSLCLESTGVFPAHGAPRVLWIGIVDSSGNLERVQQSLEVECQIQGFSRETRAFHPHLTIARQRAPQGTRTPPVFGDGPQFPRVEFPVNEIVVIRSELSPEGSRYTTLSRHMLNATRAD